MLPYGDDFFLSTTWNASGDVYLTFTNASLPVADDGGQIDPVAGGFDDVRGFPVLGPYVAYFPGLSLDLSSLPRLWNISSSDAAAAAGGNVALLNTRTLALESAWVELDHSGDSGTDPTPYERALLLWPAARLADATEYVVAFRRLLDDAGLPVAPSDGFAALRDGVKTDDPAVEASRARFARIFGVIEAAPLGWARAELTLAWSFTTNSQDDITRRFLHMRDDALARVVASGGVKYTVGAVDDAPAPGVARRVHGQFFVPTYLPYDGVPALDSHLVLDPVTGLPVFQSLTPYDFELSIPESLANGSVAPAGVLQYGHGLFGDHGEVEEGYLNDEAGRNGWVLAATDWIGLSEYDEPTVVVMLASSFTDFRIVPDRLHQGMLNALVLMRMLAPGQPFLSEPCLRFGGGPAGPGGVVSANASQRFYTGNSQGGIMGSVYMAVTTDVLLGVCGVGGGPYSLLLPRSSDFSDLFLLLKLRYPRSLDRILAIALFQSLWDRMDPAGYAGYVTGAAGAAGGPGALPNTPSHRVAFHYGLGDHQVTWLGQLAIARSAGARMYASNVREGNETLSVYAAAGFLDDGAVVTAGNVVQGFDYGFPVVPFVNLPPSSGPDAHECPRRTPAAQAQMARFFATGEIVNFCAGGACHISPVPC